MHMMDWYTKEQNKKKNMMKANDIALINQELKKIVLKVLNHIDRSNYEDEANRAEYHVSQCSIWDVSYRNNMENEHVALSQALLVSYILEREELENKERLQNEVDILMRRLGNVDWGMYLEYSELRGHDVK